MDLLQNQNKIALVVKVKKVVSHAKLPTQATEGSVGFDLSSAEDFILLPGKSKPISTALKFAVPKGIYGRIAPRSSLALQNINVGGGVIDNDYRGEVKVILQNMSQTNLVIKQGQRIAQIIFEQASIPCLVLTEELDKTKRGEK